MSANTMQLVIHSSYFIAALLFIVGLQRMSSPVTARNGILWAGGAGAPYPYVRCRRVPGREVRRALRVGAGVRARRAAGGARRRAPVAGRRVRVHHL